ncbi:hypothetical protein KY284_019995 [Solanum tuberosum]|nr:hypothetical protein KY284_019995 [Solanum tuberosum]
MGVTSRVVTADTNIGVTNVQFNPASQLHIKLHGSQNFSMWKAQFSMLMHGHDLYGHLNGSAPSPSRTITTGTVPNVNHPFLFGFSKTNLFRIHLWHRLIPELPQLLQPLTRQNLSKKFSLRDQLTRLTKDSQPVTEYLQNIISDELSTAGAPVTKSELIVKILSGLGPEFREISTVIRVHDSTITYEELYEKLLDHELFLHQEESNNS